MFQEKKTENENRLTRYILFLFVGFWVETFGLKMVESDCDMNLRLPIAFPAEIVSAT